MSALAYLYAISKQCPGYNSECLRIRKGLFLKIIMYILLMYIDNIHKTSVSVAQREPKEFMAIDTLIDLNAISTYLGLLYPREVYCTFKFMFL